MAKFFELTEANAFIPSLTRAFERMTMLRAELDTRLEDLQAQGVFDVSPYINSPEQAPEPVREMVTRIAKVASILESEIRTIHETGALVKDLDLGLVDFPGRVNGKDVYLCWKVGEPEIRFWHDVDKGFRERRPLLRVVGRESDTGGQITDPGSLN